MGTTTDSPGLPLIPSITFWTWLYLYLTIIPSSIWREHTYRQLSNHSSHYMGLVASHHEVRQGSSKDNWSLKWVTAVYFIFQKIHRNVYHRAWPSNTINLIIYILIYTCQIFTSSVMIPSLTTAIILLDSFWGNEEISSKALWLYLFWSSGEYSQDHGFCWCTNYSEVGVPNDQVDGCKQRGERDQRGSDTIQEVWIMQTVIPSLSYRDWSSSIWLD